MSKEQVGVAGWIRGSGARTEGPRTGGWDAKALSVRGVLRTTKEVWIHFGNLDPCDLNRGPRMGKYQGSEGSG